MGFRSVLDKKTSMMKKVKNDEYIHEKHIYG